MSSQLAPRYAPHVSCRGAAAGVVFFALLLLLLLLGANALEVAKVVVVAVVVGEGTSSSSSSTSSSDDTTGCGGESAVDDSDAMLVRSLWISQRCVRVEKGEGRCGSALGSCWLFSPSQKKSNKQKEENHDEAFEATHNSRLRSLFPYSPARGRAANGRTGPR